MSTAPGGQVWDSHWVWIAGLAFVTLVFFWEPLTSAQASIQWDAADYYYVVQKYFADEVHSGRMPFWTPYVWSGYPFLADPQVGAWYPLNWPFFVFGVLPRTIQFENFVHSLVACVGAYALAFRFVSDKRAAAFAGMCYGLCGWFVGHSSHTTMVEAAAWLPWLLLAYLCWEAAHRGQCVVWGILLSGLIVVAGHFQTTLYSFLALGLFAIARWISGPPQKLWQRSVVLLIPVGGVFLSAIHTLPGLELARQSMRATFSAITRTEGFIHPRSLLTLIYPDSYGLLSGNYRGPSDLTQYYLYAGLLLLPLAAAGLKDRSVRWIGILLAGFCVWYAVGHKGGLYYLIARLPAFSSIRAPINIWFVPTLALALLAAAGFVVITRKWPAPWVPFVLLIFAAADLFYFNSSRNPLLYARATFEELYGEKERMFENAVGSHLPPLTRFEAPEALPSFGPMSHPLDTRIEVSYGYGPLKLQRYLDYTSAMTRNPKLRDDLNVSRYYSVRNQQAVMDENPTVLPRVNFPKNLIAVRTLEESKAALERLDPHESALLPAEVSQRRQDPAATVEVVNHEPGLYRLRYRAATDSVLRLSMACFPGWQAQVNGRSLPIFCVDHTLTGLVVPAGSEEVVLRYRPTYFAAGAIATLIGLALCAVGLFVFRGQPAAGHET